MDYLMSHLELGIPGYARKVPYACQHPEPSLLHGSAPQNDQRRLLHRRRNHRTNPHCIYRASGVIVSFGRREQIVGDVPTHVDMANYKPRRQCAVPRHDLSVGANPNRHLTISRVIVVGVGFRARTICTTQSHSDQRRGEADEFAALELERSENSPFAGQQPLCLVTCGRTGA